MNNLLNTLSRESLLTESPLDIIENLSVSCVGLIQHVSELEVCLAKPITEMLSEYPSTIYKSNRSSIYGLKGEQKLYLHA